MNSQAVEISGSNYPNIVSVLTSIKQIFISQATLRETKRNAGHISCSIKLAEDTKWLLETLSTPN